MLEDSFVLPPDQQQHYDERIAWLPHCCLPSDTRLHVPAAVPARRDEGLPDSGFVFCSFNSYNKITAAVFDVWMHLLLRVDAETEGVRAT